MQRYFAAEANLALLMHYQPSQSRACLPESVNPLDPWGMEVPALVTLLTSKVPVHKGAVGVSESTGAFREVESTCLQTKCFSWAAWEQTNVKKGTDCQPWNSNARSHKTGHIWRKKKKPKVEVTEEERTGSWGLNSFHSNQHNIPLVAVGEQTPTKSPCLDKGPATRPWRLYGGLPGCRWHRVLRLLSSLAKLLIASLGKWWYWGGRRAGIGLGTKQRCYGKPLTFPCPLATKHKRC